MHKARDPVVHAPMRRVCSDPRPQLRAHVSRDGALGWRSLDVHGAVRRLQRAGCRSCWWKRHSPRVRLSQAGGRHPVERTGAVRGRVLSASVTTPPLLPPQGVPLGFAADQFLRYTFIVTDVLISAGLNNLSLAFSNSSDPRLSEGRITGAGGGWDWGTLSRGVPVHEALRHPRSTPPLQARSPRSSTATQTTAS